MNAAAVEGTSLEFKSISFSAVNGADDFSFNGRQLHHSWNSDIAISDRRAMEENDLDGDSGSHDTKSLQSEDEVYNNFTVLRNLEIKYFGVVSSSFHLLLKS